MIGQLAISSTYLTFFQSGGMFIPADIRDFSVKLELVEQLSINTDVSPEDSRQDAPGVTHSLSPVPARSEMVYLI